MGGPFGGSVIRKLLQIIGAAVTLGCTLGAIGLIDFRLCMAPVGGCDWTGNAARPVFTKQST